MISDRSGGRARISSVRRERRMSDSDDDVKSN